jgi:hypothetical protein
MTQEEVVIAKFDESVPKLLQRDMLRTVLADYQDSDKRVRRRYPPSEAITLRGHVRRADIEVDFRSVADKYISHGAKGTVKPNSTGSIFHSVMAIGEVKLTQSKLPNPRRVVKPSSFREDYAQESAQMFFSFMNKRPRKVVAMGEKEYLYAVLTHGCRKNEKSRPYFVRFAFPNKNCTAWLAQIDLMKRFSDVVQEFYAPVDALENEERRVRLKRGIKRGGKERPA